VKIPAVYSFLLLMAVAVFCAAEGSKNGYLVGEGDVLEVTSFQHQELCGSFQVSEKGVINYPLVGQVKAAGRRVGDISAELERLLEADYFVDVQLSIEVREFNSQPVVVLGEVRRPGTVFLNGQTMLTDIIAEAGGLSSGAGPEIELRRAGAAEVLVFSTQKVRTGEEGRDVEIRQGDVISVSSKKLFFVTGEVRSPGQYEIARGLTLMRAVSQAGGLSKFASRIIEIHREIDDEKVIQNYDLGDIRKGKAEDPAILPDDVIIVRRRFF
jgi:polysaccharide export outer membrane protein